LFLDRGSTCPKSNDRRMHACEVDRWQHTEYLGYAMGYCRERGRIGELESLQVFWPDKAGHFPFEASCVEPIRALQPRLDLPFEKAAQRGK
jgi:hypothetical protein